MARTRGTRTGPGFESGNIQVAANGQIQLAQADYYYGYCFDTGIDEYCYWYPAADVIVTGVWIEYTPV